MKKTSITYYISTILIISSFCTFQVFAENKNTGTSRESEVTFSTFSRIESWAYQLLALNPNTYVHLTAVESFPRKSDVLITWNVDKIATGVIYYDTVSPVSTSSNTPLVAASIYGTYAQSKANIRFLRANTTYYYKIIIKDASGSEVTSNELQFTTAK
jgi:hypothetical protein